MDKIQQQVSELMQKLTASENQIAREKEFSEIAEKRFRANLQAFKSFYPDIAKSIEDFQSDTPIELFVTETGYGNIREHKTGIPLYSDDPIAQVSKQVEKHVNTPFVNHINFTKYADISDDDERLHSRHLKKLGIAVKEAGEYQRLEVLPERFPTAVIFGIGLGYHLPMLLERTQFDYIYLIEPSFENFYSSLFCIDWKSLIEKVDEQYGVLIFQLGASYQTFVDDLYRVSQDLGAFTLTKCFCYQHYPSKSTGELIQQFYQRLFEMHSGYGFYNDATTAIAHTVANANRGMNLMKMNGRKEHPYKDFPVYVVGNGPSLDDSIDFIKENQDKAIIIAAGTALQTLLKNDILPDFHTLIERPKNTYDALIDSLPAEQYKRLNLLTMNLIYPDVVPLYNWVGMSGKRIDAGGDLLNYVLLSEKARPLTFLLLCNPLVSNTALSYALYMGFREIYLFGVDNGYSPDGQHHASDSDYYKGKFKDRFKAQSATHKLEGNLGGHVMATNLLAMSCQQMGRLLEARAFKKVVCYNVGRGAKINNALPLKPEHVLAEDPICDKEQVVTYVKENMFDFVQLENFENYMRFDKYDEICSHLLSIANEPIESRAEALDNLRRQARYLYSHRGTRYSHLHYVLEGELLYFQCPLISLLFNNNDSDDCLRNFKKGLSKWCDFLREAQTDLKESWLEKCTMSYKK